MIACHTESAVVAPHRALGFVLMHIEHRAAGHAAAAPHTAPSVDLKRPRRGHERHEQRIDDPRLKPRKASFDNIVTRIPRLFATPHSLCAIYTSPASPAQLHRSRHQNRATRHTYWASVRNKPAGRSVIPLHKLSPLFMSKSYIIAAGTYHIMTPGYSGHIAHKASDNFRQAPRVHGKHPHRDLIGTVKALRTQQRGGIDVGYFLIKRLTEATGHITRVTGAGETIYHLIVT